MSASVMLAPMSGISDVAFRRIAARFGATLVFTEMVAADSYLRGSEEARLRSMGEGVRPHAVQLVGRDPIRMAEAARLAVASGAELLDINFGCPAKSVTGGLAGSALMREPKLALSIVEAVAQAVSVPVSLKMRLGWDHGSLNAPYIAQRGEAAGVRAITVHGRTRQQFYKGQADWAAIRSVVNATRLPVVANGDVVDLASARACLAAAGTRGVMIGRAAVGQPWIVGDIRAALNGERASSSPDPAAMAEAAGEHYETILSLYGVEIGARHARKHLAAYADRAAAAGHAGLASAERRELVTSDSPSRVAALLGRIYDEPLRVAA